MQNDKVGGSVTKSRTSSQKMSPKNLKSAKYDQNNHFLTIKHF